MNFCSSKCGGFYSLNIYFLQARRCTHLFTFQFLELKKGGSNSSKSKCSHNCVVSVCWLRNDVWTYALECPLGLFWNPTRLCGSMTGNILSADMVILMEAAPSIGCTKNGSLGFPSAFVKWGAGPCSCWFVSHLSISWTSY